MKQFSRLFLLSLAIFTFSCGEDDEEGSSYEFKDQTAQGTINDKSWTFISGKALIRDGKLSVDLGADEDFVSCESFHFNGSYIFFTLDEATGVSELKFDLNDFDNSQTATMYDPDEGDFGLNIIATEGAIEIISITDTEVKGRIDIRDGHDNSSSVNGNFTVPICE